MNLTVSVLKEYSEVVKIFFFFCRLNESMIVLFVLDFMFCLFFAILDHGNCAFAVTLHYITSVVPLELHVNLLSASVVHLCGHLLLVVTPYIG